MNALLVQKYVKRGSRVFSDCWRAYDDMVNLDLNLTHETVNHSETFRNGEVCTNTIGGTWSGIKVNVSPLAATRVYLEKKACRWYLGKVLRAVSYDQANINPACLAELLPEEDELSNIFLNKKYNVLLFFLITHK